MRSIVYHQAAGGCTLARDEIQGRFAALDDIKKRKNLISVLLLLIFKIHSANSTNCPFQGAAAQGTHQVLPTHGRVCLDRDLGGLVEADALAHLEIPFADFLRIGSYLFGLAIVGLYCPNTFEGIYPAAWPNEPDQALLVTRIGYESFIPNHTHPLLGEGQMQNAAFPKDEQVEQNRHCLIEAVFIGAVTEHGLG